MLPDALHSIRSLLCPATNSTPHERFFAFMRRSPNGKSLPGWLSSPGPVFLRSFVRSNKIDDMVEEVELTDANPLYARVRFPDDRESNVLVRDLAPCPTRDSSSDGHCEDRPVETAHESAVPQVTVPQITDPQISNSELNNTRRSVGEAQESDPAPRRSTRKTRGVPPVRYGVYE